MSYRGGYSYSGSGSGGGGGGGGSNSGRERDDQYRSSGGGSSSYDRSSRDNYGYEGSGGANRGGRQDSRANDYDRGRQESRSNDYDRDRSRSRDTGASYDRSSSYGASSSQRDTGAGYDRSSSYGASSSQRDTGAGYDRSSSYGASSSQQRDTGAGYDRSSSYGSSSSQRDTGAGYGRSSSYGGSSSHGGSSYVPSSGGGPSSYGNNNGTAGGRGYGGRGGGGRGGGSRYATGPRPTVIKIRTNYFPLKIPENLVFYQYQVEIKRAELLRRPTKDSENFYEPPSLGHDGSGENIDINEKKAKVPIDQGRFIVPVTARDGNEKAPIKLENSTALSRRILFETLKKVQDQMPPLATDGGSLLLSSTPIRDEFLILPIRTTPDCDADDAFYDQAKKEWFIVTLTKTGMIDYSSFQPMKTGQDKFRQGLDVIIKHSLERIGLKTFGKSPRVFYFDNNLQASILGDTLRKMYSNMNARFMPWVGVSEATRIGEGGTFIAVDAKVDYIDREGMQLINERAGTVVGVRIDNFHRPIPVHLHKDITDALDKITFHVQYKRGLSEEFVQRMRARGISEDKIKGMADVVRRNKRMTKDTKKGVGILWAADDLDEYFFEQKPRKGDPEDKPVVRYTIASYYHDVYGIRLRYPKMPIVFIGKKEWYPMEFLTQALAKTTGANNADQVRGVLGYYDEFAGLGCIDNIQRLSRMAQIDEQLRRFNLVRDLEPVTLDATVLPEPKLTFGRNESASINNGSWDLRNKKFAKPAGLRAFAVVDFSSGGRSMPYVKNLLRVCVDHGIHCQIDHKNDNIVKALTVTGSDANPDSITMTMGKAIEKAKLIFFRDAEGIFRRNNAFFKTRAWKTGFIHEVLVIPPPSEEYYGHVGVILRMEVYPPTHIINEVPVRIMVKVQGRQDLVDPFDFEYDVIESAHKVRGERVSFERFVFIDQNKNEVSAKGESPSPATIISEKLLEDPVMIVYLKDSQTAAYNQVKMASWHIFGVPSACAVHLNFEKQKSKDNYCSSIALKLNSKLSTSNDQARAWLTSDGGNVDIPWIREVPTLVLGISVSHGFGSFGAKSVVSATVALDPGCMVFAQNVRVQSKAELINELILRDLLIPLLLEFKKRTGCAPQRIVVYRDGVSDGSLDRVKLREVRTIRRAYLEFLQELNDNSSPLCSCCENRGCPACCPPITFIACLMQHNIKICPATQTDAVKNNVPSGTCVDHTIVHFTELTLSDDKDQTDNIGDRLFPTMTEDVPSSYDFILTAHGGLKGTSKPVYYRVLLNDNLTIKPLGSGSGTPLSKIELQKMTYHMSFQYGTATKAVRTVPVLYYSSRLATVVMGYLRSLLDRHFVKVTVLDEDESNKPRNRFGELQNFEIYVREDMSKHEGIPVYAKSDLLPTFTIGIRDLENPGPGQPFFCHLSA